MGLAVTEPELTVPVGGAVDESVLEGVEGVNGGGDDSVVVGGGGDAAGPVRNGFDMGGGGWEVTGRRFRWKGGRR
jgi:hypothetical protein